MKTLLTTKNQYKKHLKIMESRLSGAPLRHQENEIPTFPSVVISYITGGGTGGFVINHEFVTEMDFGGKS